MDGVAGRTFAVASLMIGLVFASGFAACGSSSPQALRQPVELVVVPSVHTIAVDDGLQLKAYLRGKDGAVRDATGEARWKSSPRHTVDVGQDGLATGRQVGSATIQVRLNQRRAVARITVRRIPKALSVSRTNPRYFEDASSRIVYLAGAHTWTDLLDSGLTDPPPRLDHQHYLDFLQAHNMNLTRLWAWEQARWTAETQGDYWFEPTVYVRTGPGTGLDGQPRFDLTRFNDDYFARLRHRVVSARRRGIYVIVMLFNGWSVSEKGPARNNPWRGHPFNAGNNVNAIDGDPDNRGDGAALHTLEDRSVTRLQEAYARRVVDSVADQSNVLFEISNESSAGSIAWQNHMVSVVSSYERGRALQHPIGISAEWPDGRNSDLLASPASWIAPNGSVDKPAPSTRRKVVVADTDHLCGVCGDASFPWKALTRGLNPLFMDVYDGRAFGLGAQDGDRRDPRWEEVRRSLGATRVVAGSLDLARMRPSGRLASSGYCLAAPGRRGAYLVYIPSGKALTIDLSGTPGVLRAQWRRPETGEVIGTQGVSGGRERTIRLRSAAPAVLILRRVR